nr:MAG TPA: hypothetical protein [Caudoviricetes sp.]
MEDDKSPLRIIKKEKEKINIIIPIAISEDFKQYNDSNIKNIDNFYQNNLTFLKNLEIIYYKNNKNIVITYDEEEYIYGKVYFVKLKEYNNEFLRFIIDNNKFTEEELKEKNYILKGNRFIYDFERIIGKNIDIIKNSILLNDNNTFELKKDILEKKVFDFLNEIISDLNEYNQ